MARPARFAITALGGSCPIATASRLSDARRKAQHAADTFDRRHVVYDRRLQQRVYLAIPGEPLASGAITEG